MLCFGKKVHQFKSSGEARTFLFSWRGIRVQSRQKPIQRKTGEASFKWNGENSLKMRKEKENGTETIFVTQKRKIFEAKNVFCSVFLPFSHQLE